MAIPALWRKGTKKKSHTQEKVEKIPKNARALAYMKKKL